MLVAGQSFVRCEGPVVVAQAEKDRWRGGREKLDAVGVDCPPRFDRPVRVRTGAVEGSVSRRQEGRKIRKCRVLRDRKLDHLAVDPCGGDGLPGIFYT
jgi:hypothetical protein